MNTIAKSDVLSWVEILDIYDRAKTRIFTSIKMQEFDFVCTKSSEFIDLFHKKVIKLW